MADGRGRILWRLSQTAIGTDITGPGNSGGFSAADPNAESPIDLRHADDLALMVHVAAIVSAPVLTVQLDVFDEAGNLYPAVAATGNIVAAGAVAPVYAGRRGSGAQYVVLPQWGRVSWACAGGSCTGVEIALYAR